MAILDAYATATNYRAQTGDKASGADAVLDAQLLTVSRLLERSLSVQPGAFNTHSATYTFDGRGGRVLDLRDRSGRTHFVTAITANSLGIDSELDGTYDGYLWDLSDAWVRGLPENAVAASEPFTRIEILPHIATAELTVWPTRPAAVRITGTWGWGAVPGAIMQLTVSLAHDLRQAQLSGALMESPPTLESGGFPMQDQSWRLWRDIRHRYGMRGSLPI
jgi:hypothetical protein